MKIFQKNVRSYDQVPDGAYLCIITVDQEKLSTDKKECTFSMCFHEHSFISNFSCTRLWFSTWEDFHRRTTLENLFKDAKKSPCWLRSPKKSVRRREVGFIHHINQCRHWKSYIPRLVRVLNDDDPDGRVAKGECVVEQCMVNPDFFYK